MKALLVSFLLRLSACLPLTWNRGIGRCLGRLVWIGGAARRVTERNIGLAFPERNADGHRELARQSLQATGELAAEMGYIWYRPWATVRDRILKVTGDEAVRDTLAVGRGVMMLGPHLGNWEVVGLHIAELGDSVALYEPPHMHTLDTGIRRARERSGTALVPTNAKGVVSLVRALKKGAIAGILPDQVPPVLASGMNSEFMGVSCFTMTLASKLLLHSGAVAFFCFAERIKGGFHVRYIPAPDEIYSDDLPTSLLALNAGVEQCLRYCPEQYQWEYKRFRERPRTEPDYYAKRWSPEQTG